MLFKNMPPIYCVCRNSNHNLKMNKEIIITNGQGTLTKGNYNIWYLQGAVPTREVQIGFGKLDCSTN